MIKSRFGTESAHSWRVVDRVRLPGRSFDGCVEALLVQSPGTQLFAGRRRLASDIPLRRGDVAVTREFPERFGDSERILLETTFRCSGRVADVATRFVLANPAQIRKRVRSTRQLRGPCA